MRGAGGTWHSVTSDGHSREDKPATHGQKGFHPKPVGTSFGIVPRHRHGCVWNGLPSTQGPPRLEHFPENLSFLESWFSKAQQKQPTLSSKTISRISAARTLQQNLNPLLSISAQRAKPKLGSPSLGSTRLAAAPFQGPSCFELRDMLRPSPSLLSMEMRHATPIEFKLA